MSESESEGASLVTGLLFIVFVILLLSAVLGFAAALGYNIFRLLTGV